MKKNNLMKNKKPVIYAKKNLIKIKKQQRFKSNHHRVYTEEVNKIALSSNDDKRFQTFYKVTTYPYGTNVFKVCKSEVLSKI